MAVEYKARSGVVLGLLSGATGALQAELERRQRMPASEIKLDSDAGISCCATD